MKRIALVILLALAVTLAPFSAFADKDYDVTTNVSGTLIGETYILDVYLTDIHDDVGIAGVEYYVNYDPEVFDLVKADIKIPESWQGIMDEEDNFSREVSDSIYCWTIMMFELGYGITDDEVLTFTLEFNVLKDAQSEIVVSPSAVWNDEIVFLKSNTVSLTVDTSNPGSELIDSDAPSYEPDYSMPNVPAESEVNESFSFEDESENVSENNQIPSVNLSSGDKSSDDTDSLDLSEPASSDIVITTILVIIGILCVVVAVVIVVIMIIQKRRKAN